MGDQPLQPRPSVKKRQRRLPWRSLLAAGLILTAAAYELGFKSRRSEFAWLRIPQEQIRVPLELTQADSIPAAPGSLAGCNVLLITLDTTRAGRLGCYGNQSIETPTFDGLARSGVLFSQALAPAPTTLPSHATILTGLYPSRHGARTNGLFRLSDENHTLAEVLSSQGYTAGAMISAFVLDSRFGLSQGFDHYDEDVGIGGKPDRLGAVERSADKTTERAINWLRGVCDGPFFLWVHYFDPHAVYSPPGPFAGRYAANPYDGEIAFIDSELVKLLEVIDESGLTDSTLVVVAGDHGEGLGEHNEHTHGYLIYDVTMKVPLIMSCGRRLGGGVQISRRVSLVDIMPTVLSLLGVETPHQFDGVDLTNPPADSRRVFAETYHGLMEYGWAALLAVYDGDHKYIHGPRSEMLPISVRAKPR